MIFERRRYSQNNYMYLIAEGGDAALVDPGDAAVALALAESRGVHPRFILHTHGHPDHTAGTARVAERLGAEVFGVRGDDSWCRPDAQVTSGPLELGALRVRAHLAPGHTAGSVLYEWNGRLMTGDTLFWGGCGNCRFGGDAARLAETFEDVVGRLDGALEIHPGHDYSENNLSFALDLEPSNRLAKDQLEAAREARSRGEEPPPTTLALERRMNPFLRPGELVDVLSARGIAVGPGQRAAFVALRGLKDRWG